MKINKLFSAMALLPFAAQAQMVPAIDSTAAVPPEMYFENQPVKLNEKELEALKLVREWKKSPDKPIRGPNGSVKYLFGATMPTMLCTPFQACAIRLQPGEVVNSVNIGDNYRWEVKPAATGGGQSAVEMLMVKLKSREPGLKTSVIIATDRRVYAINLVSTKHEWIPIMEFEYPDDMDQTWKNYKARVAKAVNASTLSTGENIAALDFNFRMSGDSPKWKPQRIYSDGVKTYIQFPSSQFADEAPALVALGKDGGFFSDPTEQLVNYRLIGDRYVVDMVLERAALVSGVGREQTRVTIEHEERK